MGDKQSWDEVWDKEYPDENLKQFKELFLQELVQKTQYVRTPKTPQATRRNADEPLIPKDGAAYLEEWFARS